MVLSLLGCASAQTPVAPPPVVAPPPPAPVAQPEVAAPAPTPARAEVELPPIPGELPTLSIDNLRFRDQYECARGVCRVEALAPAVPTRAASADGASTVPPSMAWLHVVRPGASIEIPRRAGVDLLGLVLVGRAALRTVEAPRERATEAAPWMAFLLPEGGATIGASDPGGAAVLLVTARDAAAPEAQPTVTGPRSRGGYVLRSMNAAEDLAWRHGAMHARIGFDATTSPRASLEVLMFSDVATVEEHAHDGSWELLAAISAAGRLHIPAQSVTGVENAVLEHDRIVTAGTIAYVPASVRHAWSPDGTHPLIAVQSYSPPGPEQRFRALAHPTAESTPQRVGAVAASRSETPTP